MNRWFQSIDAYCERIDASFWSEPLNAVSNLAFLLAAFLAWRAWRADGGRDWPTFLLILVAAAVGVGSFLFHTVATRWAMIADVAPIAIFIHGYFLLAMHRFFGLGLLAALALTAVFLGLSLLGAPLLRPVLGSSAGYAPALLALAGVGLALLARHPATGRQLLAGAAIFAMSLACRIADQEVCAIMPIGTHFLWHLLNGLLLYLLLRTALEAHAGRIARV